MTGLLGSRGAGPPPRRAIQLGDCTTRRHNDTAHTTNTVLLVCLVGLSCLVLELLLLLVASCWNLAVVLLYFFYSYLRCAALPHLQTNFVISMLPTHYQPITRATGLAECPPVIKTMEEQIRKQQW